MNGLSGGTAGEQQARARRIAAGYERSMMLEGPGPLLAGVVTVQRLVELVP